MNDFLIDTHVFLWLNFSPQNLSPSILRSLQDKKNQIFVSVITFWEISLKYQLGKLALPGLLPHELLVSAEEMDIKIANLTPEDYATFFQLPSAEKHKDPFDRLIIWQCITQKKTLVSHDLKLDAYIKLGLRVLR